MSSHRYNARRGCGPADPNRRRLLGALLSGAAAAALRPRAVLVAPSGRLAARDPALERILPYRPLRRPWVRVFRDGAWRGLGYDQPWVRLNETAWAIWQRCDGRRTVAEIAAELAEEAGLPPEAVTADVAGAVQTLGRFALLDVAGTGPLPRRVGCV